MEFVGVAGWLSHFRLSCAPLPPAPLPVCLIAFLLANRRTNAQQQRIRAAALLHLDNQGHLLQKPCGGTKEFLAESLNKVQLQNVKAIKLMFNPTSDLL